MVRIKSETVSDHRNTHESIRKKKKVAGARGARFVALLLCILMVLSTMPITVSALERSDLDDSLYEFYDSWLISESSRYSWIERYIKDDPTHSIAPLDPATHAEEYAEYRSLAKYYGLKGDGRIFVNPKAVRFSILSPLYYPGCLILEDNYLKTYYEKAAEYWWSLLTESERLKYLDQWILEAIDNGITADNVRGEIRFCISEDIFNHYSQFRGMPAVNFTPDRVYLEYFRAAFGISNWNSYSNAGYILRVKTGALDGTNVMYLGVRYRDVNGFERTEFIFPHEGSLADGYRAAELAGNPAKRLETVKEATDYTVKNSYGNVEGLSANSLDYYYIRPRYELDELLGVDVFLRYPMDKVYTKGWTCEGMHFYRVDELYGVEMAGYYSDSYFISFKGELISMLKMQGDAVDFELDQADTLSRLGRETGTGYSFVRVNQPYDSRSDEFYFKLDIADVFGGGIEALATQFTDGRRLLNVAEGLTLCVTYEDTFGEKQTVNMPMLTSQLAFAVESGVLDSQKLPIAGVAQQGDSIVFPGLLPNFVKPVRIELVYGSAAAAAAGIECPETSGRTARLNEMKEDVLHITGMQIYGSDAQASAYVEGAVLRTEIASNVNPLYYFVVNDVNGLVLTGGRYDLTERLTAYSAGDALKPANSASQYVVVISTDDMDRAGTTADIMFKVGYLSTTGVEKESDYINLRDAAKSIYGYWPGVGGDTAYEIGVAPGGALILTLALNDVNRFTSATFTISPSANDDWQMKDIRIYSASELSERKITWENVPGSDRRITREFGASDKKLVARFPNALDGSEDSKVFLGGDSFSKTILFGENSRSVIEEDEPIDWNRIRYSMTLKEAMQDLGFDRVAATYKVEVKVASNSEASSGNGDCGSQNLFYFKLFFENGSSGYILANQQLTADGFRADRVETFYVSTNEDYGALTAVSIIPEDDSGSDNQDPFDKLNISSITVSKQSSESLSMTWRISKVGWIDVNYRDKGAETTSGGRKGRTEGELAHTYSTDSQGYSLNLLFAVTTGSYERSADDVNSGASRENPAYRGALTATVEYYDNTGSLRKESIDVARAMYEYAALDPKYYNESSVKTGNTDETRAMVDPDFMLRGNHTDRFIVSLPDVRQIVRVRFGASSEVSTLWRLNSVKVYQITSGGQLQLDSRGEYKRTNQIEQLCESVDSMGYELRVFAPESRDAVLGEEQGLTVNFTTHQLDIKTSGGDWTSSISREPLNKNDTLNIYVYMRDDKLNDPITSYELKGNVNWYNADGDFNRSDSLGNMNRNEDAGIFWYSGLKVSGFGGINNIRLVASSRDGVMAHADHVIIQHVRSGVTLDTYYINLNGSNLFNQQPYSNFTKDPSDKSLVQTVKLAVSADSGTSPLLGVDETDLAVAIHYRTKQDMNRGDTSQSYNSRYVFLSDLTDQAGNRLVDKILPGMTFEVPFGESYVGEITGVTLATVGGFEVTLDSACVEVTDTANKSCVGWYDLAEGAVISTTPYTLGTTETSVVPVKMSFKTTQNAEILGTGTDSGDVPPIRMTVVYTSALSGNRDQLVISDISRYLTNGKFRLEEDGSAATATIAFFMKDVASIRSILLEPYTTNAQSNAIWGVGDVSYEAIIGRTTKSHTSAAATRTTGGETASEGAPLAINLSTVAIKLTASTFIAATGVTAERNTNYGGTAELTVKPGQTVTVTPEILGTLDGYGFETLITRADGTALPASAYAYTADRTAITFVAPELAGTEPEIYQICVSSAEEPQKQCSLILTVEPAA